MSDTIHDHVVVPSNAMPGAAKFQQQFCRYLAESLETSKRILGTRDRKRREGMVDALHRYVDTLPKDSAALTALYRLEASVGRKNGDEYSPGTKQAQVINQLGTGATPDVSPVDALYEVIAAGAEDARLALTKKIQKGVDKVKEDTKREVQGAFHSAAQKAQDETRRVSVENDQLKTQLTAVTAERDWLTSLVDPDVVQNGDAKPERVRRQKIDGQPGIYRTVRADGIEVFEAKVDDNPWQTVGSDPKEAARVRDQLKAAA